MHNWFSVVKPPDVVAHQWLEVTNSWLHDFGAVILTHRLNAEAYSHLAYGVTGRK